MMTDDNPLSPAISKETMTAATPSLLVMTMSDKPQPQPHLMTTTMTSPMPSAPSNNSSQPHLQCINANVLPLPVSIFFSYFSIFNVSIPPHTSMTTTHMTMVLTMSHMVAAIAIAQTSSKWQRTNL